jgi:hypothetical protein
LIIEFKKKFKTIKNIAFNLGILANEEKDTCRTRDKTI